MIHDAVGLIPAAGKGIRLALPYPKELYPIIRDNRYKPVAQFVVDDLVASGDLTPGVADEVQAGFRAAAWHVWASTGQVSCYFPSTGPDYGSVSARELNAQAQALADISASGQLDGSAVAKARSAIERDLTFLALTVPEQEALYERLLSLGPSTWGDIYVKFGQVGRA